MDTIQRLILGMDNARRFSEGLLSAFKTAEEWTHQLFPGANHALWFAGHMAMVDNSFLKRTADKGVDKPDWATKFGRGSQATGNPADYPAAEEVLSFMRDRRKLMMEAIAKYTDADLSKPLPQGFPPFLPDFGQLFAFFTWHEGVHAGQVSMIRRALGHPPIAG
jgi:hypothetical protein